MVALVGYTNAGKSTLFNALTRGGARGLGPALHDARPARAQGRLGPARDLLLVDTVGFIRKLPHSLVAAFRATLEEVVEADLLLHVVDAARPRTSRSARRPSTPCSRRSAPARGRRCWCSTRPTGGSRAARARARGARPGSLPVSALTGEGLDDLLERVAGSRLELAPAPRHAALRGRGPPGDRARLRGRPRARHEVEAARCARGRAARTGARAVPGAPAMRPAALRPWRSRRSPRSSRAPAARRRGRPRPGLRVPRGRPGRARRRTARVLETRLARGAGGRRESRDQALRRSCCAAGRSVAAQTGARPTRACGPARLAGRSGVHGGAREAPGLRAGAGRSGLGRDPQRGHATARWALQTGGGGAPDDPACASGWPSSSCSSPSGGVAEAHAALERRTTRPRRAAYRRRSRRRRRWPGCASSSPTCSRAAETAPAAIDVLEADPSEDRQVLLRLGGCSWRLKQYQRALDA